MTVRADIPQTHHIGFVAHDAYAMARAYEKLLGAKFDLLPPLPVRNLYDEPAKIKVAYGAFAGLVVEIIEPMEGDMPHRRWLDKYGEGIQHIGFQVPDPQKATADLLAMGAKMEWIVDDTNHTSIGYLKPDSTNEEMVRRITPDCLTYLDANIGNVCIEFMGPRIQGRMLTRWEGKLGDEEQSRWTEAGDGREISTHPLLGELIVSRPDNWFTGERKEGQ